jgi:DNA-binding GntR family transcriptional regulator
LLQKAPRHEPEIIQLAARFGYNRHQINHAIREFIDDGYITRTKRGLTWIFQDRWGITAAQELLRVAKLLTRHATKALMKVTKPAQNMDDATTIAKTLSHQHGGAWIILVKPFSSPGDPVDFLQFKSPSTVPDHYFDVVHGTMYVDGKEHTFTHAAIIREQNRGLGAD